MNEEELILRCSKNDPEAQKILYVKYYKSICQISYGYVKDYHESEDVAIEVMEKVLRKIGTYRKESSLWAWIRRICINVSLDRIRRSKKSLIRDIEGFDQGYMDRSMDKMDYNIMMREIDKMKEADREVFHMHVLGGYKHREIAEELGITESSSKSNLHRSIKRLKKENKIFSAN